MKSIQKTKNSPNPRRNSSRRSCIRFGLIGILLGLFMLWVWRVGVGLWMLWRWLLFVRRLILRIVRRR